MPIIKIPYGEGLERTDGVMVKDVNTHEDLRNVFLFRGKAQVRKGLLDVGTVLAGTITIMLAPLRWLNAGVAASYNSANRVITLTRLDIFGQNPAPIGDYGTLAGTAQYDPPITVAADSDEILLIAHSEPVYTSRLPTRYYNPSDPTNSDNLYDLTSDLGAPVGEETIKFRGVTRHLSYIFGWGHGQGEFPDRPDVIRASNSGQPLIYQDFSFFEAGQRAEPVMVCRSAGQFLMVFKENETYQIFGYSPDTFGIRPSDTLFGCVGERLAVTVGNNVFFWSTQGPRMTNGGESVDLSIPLDIDGPDPATLVDEGFTQDAFAEYDPENRVVNFVWGKRVYALSIRYPSEPKWSYYELGEQAQCGSQFFSSTATSGGGGDPPVGGPEILAIYPHGPGATYPADGNYAGEPEFIPPDENPQNITIRFQNDDSTGGEFVEIYSTMFSTPGLADLGYKQVILTLPVGGSANPLIGQLYQWDGGSTPFLANQTLPLYRYDFALRYQRGSQYDPLWTGTQSSWPAESQGFTTTLEVPPTFVLEGGRDYQGIWERTSPTEQEITITVQHAPGHQFLNFEFERRIDTNGDASVQDVDGNGVGPPDTADQTVIAFAPIAIPTAPGTELIVQVLDSLPTSDRFNIYRSNYIGESADGAYSANLKCWPGPDAPKINTLAPANFDEPSNAVFISWINATTGTIPAVREMDPYGLNATQQAQNEWNQQIWGQSGGAGNPKPSGLYTFAMPDTVLDDVGRIGQRYKATVEGVVHYSYWTLVTASINYISGTLGPQE